MKVSIHKKILLCSLLPVCVLGMVVIIIMQTYVKNSIIDEVKKSLQGTAVATLAAYDQNFGTYIQAENGDIWKGSYNISQSENLVDMIKEKSGTDVTFFYGSQRVMTSAFDKNGQRILGSPAGEKIAEHVLKNGEDYFSDNISVDGTAYYGYYVPVYQTDDKSAPIGMVFAGINKDETLGSVLRITGSVVILVLVIMAFCGIVTGLLAVSITRALKKSINNVQQVASGKLNIEIDNRIIRRKDEVGDLSRAIRSLKEELKKIIGGINNSADRLSDASDALELTSHETVKNISNVKNAVDVITEGAASQAENIRSASDNIGHMGSLITETGKEANDLNVSADKMKASSDRAAVTIEELRAISEEVKTAVSTIVEQTHQTNESARRIKEASDFISDIAEETNLLSLNASIEAARAGEAGRGFAIVAAQIQKLAEQSNNASGSIDEIVNALIHNSEQAVVTMSQMQDVMNRQNAHIEGTEKTVSEVAEEIKASVQSIRSIKNKAKELENARTEIVNTISVLSGIAEDNVASTEETNAVITEVAERFRDVEEAAANLRNTADMLVQNMGDFKE